jgi:hypothetical protein
MLVVNKMRWRMTMVKTIEAVYDSDVFHPLDPLALEYWNLCRATFIGSGHLSCGALVNSGYLSFSQSTIASYLNFQVSILPFIPELCERIEVGFFSPGHLQ